MADSQPTWDGFFAYFIPDYQSVLQALKETYETNLDITTFEQFSERLANPGRLESEISNFASDTPFILAFCEYIKSKANELNSWEEFSVDNDIYNGEIIANFYQARELSFQEFQNIEVANFAKDFVSSIAQDTDFLADYVVNLHNIYVNNPNPPTLEIIEQPKDFVGCSGDLATFNVQPNIKNVRYEWYRTDNVTQANYGNSYSFELTAINPELEVVAIIYYKYNEPNMQSVVSNRVMALVNIPIIETQPQSKNVEIGRTVNFSVSVQGQELQYQWRKDEENIEGAIEPTLTINNVGLEDAGGYDCIIVSPCAGRTTNKATLEVNTSVSNTIRGKILTAQREPAQEYTVKAFRSYLGEETIIGETITDEKGNYTIYYEPSENINSKKLSLLIEVSHPGVKQRSPLIMGAAKHQVINMITTKERLVGINEFEQLEEWFNKNLASFDWDQVKEQDIENFSEASNFPSAWIRAYAQAKTFTANESHIQGYYALIRSNSAFKKKNFLYKEANEAIDALKTAKKRKIIPESFDEDQFTTYLYNDFKSEVDNLLSSAPDSKINNFIDLAGFSGASQNVKSKFFTLQKQYQNNAKEFWSQIDSDADFDTYQQGLKLISQMGAVTAVNMDLMQHIKSSHSSLSGPEDLVLLNEADLKQDILDSGSTVPSFIKGKNSTEKRNNYARWISERIEESYPTLYMYVRIKENPSFPSQQDFGVFFSNNTDFELDKISIHQYLSDNPNALEGITDPEEFTDNLLRVQRFHSIAPRGNRARVTSALVAKDYRSAPQIAQTPAQLFFSNVSDVLDHRTASQLYNTAREVTARSINFLGKYHQGLNASEFSVIRGNVINTDNTSLRQIFPNIESLLGETDYCACEHCKSVFGPAAYLVDLLQFCQEIETNGINLYELLTQTYEGLSSPRRGDMPKIDLTCDNTNVVLPSIDIINELLCKLVDHNFPSNRQTAKTAAELRITPQYPPTNEVNQSLIDQVFPWVLPFDYYATSAYLQLPIADTSRNEIAWKFPKQGGDGSSEELQIIRTMTGLELSVGNWSRLKMDAFDLSQTYGVEGSVSGIFESSGSLLIEKLIDHVGLSFDRFKKLLQTATLNPYKASGDRTYSITYTGDGCSLESARINNIANFYQRLYYLEKLSSTLDWNLTLSDHYIRGNNLLNAIDSANTDELTQALHNLSLQQKLSEKLKIQFNDVLSWLTVLNTNSLAEDTLTQFEQIYKNPELGYNYTDAELEGLQLNGERTEIETPKSLLAMKGVVRASLQINNLDELVNSNWLGDDNYQLNLSLKRYSQLYAYVELANALNLEINELVVLWGKFNDIEQPPLENNYDNLLDLLDFVEFMERLHRSNFKVDELLYLFTDRSLEPILPEAKQTEFLIELRKLLKETWETKLLGLKNTASGIHFLLKTQTISEVQTDDLDHIDLIIKGEYDEEVESQLLDWWYDFDLLSATNINLGEFQSRVIEIYATEPYLKDPQDRIHYIYKVFADAQQTSAGEPSLMDTVFSNYLQQFAVESFVSHFIKDYPNVAPLQNELLTKASYLTIPQDSTTPVIDIFTDRGFVEEEDTINPSNYPQIYSAFQLIFKNVVFLSKFPNIDKYYQLFYNQIPNGWPQPAKLPLTGQPDPEEDAMIKGLLEVWRLQQVEKYLALHQSELVLMLLQIQIGELAGEQNIQERLEIISTWRIDQIQHLTISFNFSDAYWLGSTWLYQLYQAFQVAGKLDAFPSVVQRWNKENLHKADSIGIQQTVRKQLKTESDRKKLIQANDYLRESLRDALVGYVVRQTSVLDGELFEKSKEGLADFLLVDIQKSSCSLTSRVKQALSAIQMLVQRSLLGIERLSDTTTFEIPAPAVKEWVWRKNYRVWEANRKVFLYPENWLLPETRDDQTQLYQSFVEEISQNDVTDENARRAVSNYLKGLHEIADMEICQIYHEEEYEDDNYENGYLTDTVHIFARTKNEPHTYYYRKWVDDAYFTPWEELPLEIEGDYLIPTKYAGKLWLFWPIFIEKGDGGGEVEASMDVSSGGNKNTYSGTPPQPNKYYEIRIAWSTEFRGQWQPKKITKETFKTQPSDFEVLSSKRNFIFNTKISNEGDLLFKSGYYINSDSNSSSYMMNKSLRFYNSNSQPKMIELDVDPNRELLPYADPYFMKNKFMQEEDVSRYNAANYPEFSRLITSETPASATLPQQFPKDALASDYAFFYGDEKHSFFVNPEVGVPVAEEVNGLTRQAFSLENTTALGSTSMSSLGIIVNQSLPTGPSNLTETVLAQPMGSSLTDTYFGAADEQTTIVVDHPDPDFPEDPGDPGYPGYPPLRPIGPHDPIVLEPHNPEEPEEETVNQPSHRFYTHYHPYADDFYREVNRYGLEGIYQPIQENLKRQLAQSDFDFAATYNPSDKVIPKYPVENIDFSSFGAYSVYNWELFYHIPMAVAQLLTANFRFAEAQQWLHYIFDPTESEGKTPERFWKIKPLYEFSKIDTEQEFLEFTQGNDENLEKLVKQWEKNPFNPHLIGRFRVSTYMRRVIMVYIENLLAWADQLFTQDSIESINEAFQLYMLAWRILGKRPEKLPAPSQSVKNIGQLIDPTIPHFSTLERIADGVSLNTINNDISFNTTTWQPASFHLRQSPVHQLSDNRRSLNLQVAQSGTLQSTAVLGGAQPAVSNFSGIRNNYNQIGIFQAPNPEPFNPAGDQFNQAASSINTLGYFCVLPNTQLNEYWDKVEDRLYKIRHCLNIEGEERSLALFEPPIDPGAIIAALAGGANLASVIQGLNAPLPYYRFRYLIDRAMALTAEVKGLGQSLKEALEKADAAELSLLREEQQQYVLDAVRKVKIKAVEEAEQSLVVLQAQRENMKYREQFYRSRKYTITEEENYLKSMQKSKSQLETARALSFVIGTLSTIPEISFGVNGAFGSPHAATKIGTHVFTGASRAAAQALQTSSSISSSRGGIENTKGGWLRRQDEWTFQAESAKKELAQLEEQINASQIRIEMAKRDLDAHDRQISNAVEMQQVIDAQFANRDLFIWMRTELSNLYRSAYNDALSLAKQAEQCFNFELWDVEGPSNAVFITTDHWNGLKKGLLSGEKLERQLRTMQTNYDAQNDRLFELNKNISLAEVDPGALLRFKQTGKTVFSIPEFIFDLDYAGQYQRRIKSIAITIPCVAGPYGNVTARLSLTGNRVRKEATLIEGEYAEQNNDARFRAGISPSQGLSTTIGTSNGNQDRGLFEFNFNQERYLPFEGAGVISNWVLELPTVYQQFDYDSISDVILHIDYTARENTGTFKQAAENYIKDNVNQAFSEGAGWSELISLKSQFSDAYYQFLHPAEGANMETSFVITNKQFPYIFNGLATEITSMMVLIRPKEGYENEFDEPQVNVKLGETENLPGYQSMDFGTNQDDKTKGLLYASFDYASSPIGGKEKSITLRKTSDSTVPPIVVPEKVEDILLLVNFKEE